MARLPCGDEPHGKIYTQEAREMLRHYSAIVVGICTICCATTSGAQYPMTPVKSTGQSVTPVFEGWYRLPNGSYALSFGYFNRNAEEIIDIPVGPDNNISPGEQNQGQPTRFYPRRHWGVFALTVPASFFDTNKSFTWTLKLHGETFAIPGHIRADWQIEAIEGEGGTGNTPPDVRFAADGPVARGPAGYTAGPMRAKVGEPVSLTVWATDDNRLAASATTVGRGSTPVTLTWFVHQGPGAVTFDTPAARVAASAPP
ncbi:MAG TPA: hypothetical protein VJR92_00930, partial [Gemmatimonadaceae bacterium]|nr:hypothetical protein [Gemmatimonadaceae bacterium]